jgi:hypothetical protein
MVKRTTDDGRPVAALGEYRSSDSYGSSTPDAAGKLDLARRRVAAERMSGRIATDITPYRSAWRANRSTKGAKGQTEWQKQLRRMKGARHRHERRHFQRRECAAPETTPVRDPARLVTIGNGENGSNSTYALWQQVHQHQDACSQTFAWSPAEFRLASDGEKQPARPLR